jgi:hypothetical protein
MLVGLCEGDAQPAAAMLTRGPALVNATTPTNPTNHNCPTTLNLMWGRCTACGCDAFSRSSIGDSSDPAIPASLLSLTYPTNPHKPPNHTSPIDPTDSTNPAS